MKPKFTTGCEACCKQTGGCESCQKCLPLYLCASGSAQNVGNPAVCCDSFTDRIPSQGCDWAASVGCETATIDITVELVRDGSDCVTRVSSYAIGQSVDFVGVLPPGMAIAGTDSDGTYYSVEISTPDMVPNPLYTQACRICDCASCLPRNLCVQLSVNEESMMPGFGCGVRTASGTAEFDCVSQWVCPPLTVGSDEYSVTLTLSESSCVILGTVGTGLYPQEFEIALEGESNGVDCASLISTTVVLLDGDGASMGTLIISDSSCDGPCSPPAAERCNGACPDLIYTESWCPEVVLTAEVIAPGCEIDGFGITLRPGTAVNTTIPAEACSRFASPRPSTADTIPTIICSTGAEYTIELTLFYIPPACTTDIVIPGNYYLGYRICGMCYTLGGTLCPVDNWYVEPGATCSPLQLDFVFSMDLFRLTPGAGSCDCCSSGSQTTGIIRITR